MAKLSDRYNRSGFQLGREYPFWGMAKPKSVGKHALSNALHPRFGGGEHGWWQACDELGAGDCDPFSAEGTNFNLTVDTSIRDPVSGTPSHRSNLCEIRRVRE